MRHRRLLLALSLLGSVVSIIWLLTHRACLTPGLNLLAFAMLCACVPLSMVSALSDDTDRDQR